MATHLGALVERTLAGEIGAGVPEEQAREFAGLFAAAFYGLSSLSPTNEYVGYHQASWPASPGAPLLAEAWSLEGDFTGWYLQGKFSSLWPLVALSWRHLKFEGEEEAVVDHAYESASVPSEVKTRAQSILPRLQERGVWIADGDALSTRLNGRLEDDGVTPTRWAHVLFPGPHDGM